MAPRRSKAPVNRAAMKSGGGIRRRDLIMAVVALIVGVAIFAYPMVSDYFSQQAQGKVISVQQDSVDNTDETKLAEEKQKAVEYNEKLLSSRTVITDPFDPNTQRVTDEEYESVLNLNGDGVMGTITIPKIHVEMPIYHGTDDETLQKGVGHLQETSVPIGGESTRSVLSGHTGLPSMKVFDNLDQLEVGDYFIITVLGEDHAYRVTSTEVVLPDETDSLVIQPGKDLCTLVTCTPYGINTHRLLVYAERCEVPEEWLNKGDSTFPAGYSNPPDKALLPSILLGLLLAALIIGGYAGIRKLRERRHAAAGGHGGKAARRVGRGTPSPSSRSAGAPSRGARATSGVQSVRPYGPTHGLRQGSSAKKHRWSKAKKPRSTGDQTARPFRHGGSVDARGSASPSAKSGSSKPAKRGSTEGRHFRE